jgi:hypothetical protein
MPIKRNTQLPGTLEMLHLFRGCCLCGCSLCYGARAIARVVGAEPWAFKPHARDVWNFTRAELLRIWRTKPQGPRRPGFKAAAHRGYGCWFPCFAEIVFDGTEWPRLDKKWPKDTQEVWESIDAGLREGSP